MQRIRIDVAVGGRFHADHMVKSFLSAGHEVQLFTSYPKSRFPELPAENIHSGTWGEMVYRLSRKLGRERAGEEYKMEAFGKWVASQRKKSRADLFFCWSSFALESFQAQLSGLKILVRDSTHIQHQMEVLKKEHQKFGFPFSPNQKAVDRELKEYELADKILVLSEFARQTFLDRGISSTKLHRVRLGVNTSLFKPRPTYEAKLPLQVCYFGSLSVRKGIYYLLEATKSFNPRTLRVSLIGPVENHVVPILEDHNHIHVHKPMNHQKLAEFAKNMDVYVFPSLEDGFPNTLVQAMASGLVPLTTKQCGPAELIRPGVNGDFIEPGNSQSIYLKLNEWLEDLSVLGTMRSEAARTAQSLTWDAYGTELNDWVQTLSAGSDAGRAAS